MRGHPGSGNESAVSPGEAAHRGAPHPASQRAVVRNGIVLHGVVVPQDDIAHAPLVRVAEGLLRGVLAKPMQQGVRLVIGQIENARRKPPVDIDQRLAGDRMLQHDGPYRAQGDFPLSLLRRPYDR